MSKFVEPSVYLVSRPSVDWHAVSQFLSDESLASIPDSIRGQESESVSIVEIAARLCYMSFGRGRRDISDFINNLLSSKDGSVFEHVNYGFVITGISRSLTHEFVRHRAGFAYSQRSQRYVDESDTAFVLPPALRGDAEAEGIMDGFTETVKSVYGDLAYILTEELHSAPGTNTDKRKAVRQAARSVLPNATETKLFVTGNVRAWRHFIEMRAAVHADREIREVAMMILYKLQEESPLLFGDFEVNALPDGSSVAVPMWSKV